jgi:hypothetical protein
LQTILGEEQMGCLQLRGDGNTCQSPPKLIPFWSSTLQLFMGCPNPSLVTGNPVPVLMKLEKLANEFWLSTEIPSPLMKVTPNLHN